MEDDLADALITPEMIDLELNALVRRFVQKQFPDAAIDSILIKETTDADGDEVVDVIVIFTSAPRLSGISGLTRKLWSEFSDRDVGFPLLSFRTAAENARLSAAA